MKKIFKKAVSIALTAAIIVTMFTANVMAISTNDFVDFPNDWSTEAFKGQLKTVLLWEEETMKLCRTAF